MYEHKITGLRREHLDDILLIEQSSFSTPWSMDSLIFEITNPLALYLVFEEEGRAVGYIGSHIILDECYITNVAVRKEFRRNGIGSLLLDRLINTAKERNIAFVTLEVRERNFPAISLYKKHGFSVRGLRPGYYEKPREAAVIMTKDLQKIQ